ncbi:MAG: redoxin domain-containing protein [Xanthomonadaceae bacterium]|nr:redoxin domain-containing protein [Xanthomonadaceae bacterium]
MNEIVGMSMMGQTDIRLKVVGSVTRLVACLAMVGLIGGCALWFPTEAGDDLAHFKHQAPQPGQQAPNATVRKLDGSEVALVELFGRRPVVLQLGSHSCPVYRYRRFDMSQLQETYQDRVDFVVVYTIEAHPVGAPSPYRDEEWLSFFNWITNTRVPQPGNVDARIAQAAQSTRELARSDLVVVDAMDDQAWRAFGAAPSAAFVIDRRGNVVLTQPWVEPDGIREALDGLLLQTD